MKKKKLYIYISYNLFMKMIKFIYYFQKKYFILKSNSNKMNKKKKMVMKGLGLKLHKNNFMFLPCSEQLT